MMTLRKVEETSVCKRIPGEGSTFSGLCNEYKLTRDRTTFVFTLNYPKNSPGGACVS